MTLAQLRARHRDKILAIARKRGARNVRVFGSVARGDQQPTSDVDFLVDFDPGRSLLDLTGFLLDLEAALGCKVDVVSSRGRRCSAKPAVRYPLNVETRIRSFRGRELSFRNVVIHEYFGIDLELVWDHRRRAHSGSRRGTQAAREFLKAVNDFYSGIGARYGLN